MAMRRIEVTLMSGEVCTLEVQPKMRLQDFKAALKAGFRMKTETAKSSQGPFQEKSYCHEKLQLKSIDFVQMSWGKGSGHYRSIQGPKPWPWHRLLLSGFLSIWGWSNTKTQQCGDHCWWWDTWRSRFPKTDMSQIRCGWSNQFGAF